MPSVQGSILPLHSISTIRKPNLIARNARLGDPETGLQNRFAIPFTG